MFYVPRDRRGWAPWHEIARRLVALPFVYLFGAGLLLALALGWGWRNAAMAMEDIWPW